MTAREKFAAAILLFAAWSALVFLGKAPVDPFVTAIHEALFALGVFTAALANPKE